MSARQGWEYGNLWSNKIAVLLLPSEGGQREHLLSQAECAGIV